MDVRDVGDLPPLSTPEIVRAYSTINVMEVTVRQIRQVDSVTKEGVSRAEQRGDKDLTFTEKMFVYIALLQVPHCPALTWSLSLSLNKQSGPLVMKINRYRFKLL